MFLVEMGEGRVFTICKNRWYSDFQARQWGLRASKRDTRIKRCGLAMLFYIASCEIRTCRPDHRGRSCLTVMTRVACCFGVCDQNVTIYGYRFRL